MAEDTDFWSFSLRVYALPGVADVLLELQNRYGGDINLVLFCAWHAATGRGELLTERIRVLDDHLRPWRDSILKPLREVRHLIGNETAFVTLTHSREARARVLDAELTCEQVAQQLLESLAEIRPAAVTEKRAAEVFRANLQAYCGYLGVPLDVQQPVLQALRPAFRNN